ncbi:hypothetical protein IAD21_05322 [Abditibacteriota bacterium]|nr:hypothetical protein IAD21_05322 [Abditibacteriota bacterium]
MMKSSLPLSTQILKVGRVLFLIFCFCWTLPAVRAQENTPLVFRTLLIIKPIGDIHSARHLKVQYQMTPQDIKAITTVFQEYVPFWINRITRGRIQWQPDVKVSTVPLTTLKAWDDGCGITPEDISEDMDAFAPQGKYDAVFVYWKSWDEETNYRLPLPYGWAIGTPEAANYSGFASVQYDVPAVWTRDSGSTECFIHEWLHLLEGFYGSREGVKLPRGGLHSGEEHGYVLNERNWKDWYGDDLNGEIKEDGSLVGLGEAAWKYGLMRDEAGRKPTPRKRNPPFEASAAKLSADAIRTSPEYLTDERRARNLLNNGDFTGGDDGSWEIQSWKNNKNAATLIPNVPERGQNSLQLATQEPDDIKIVQKVKVKRRTNYFLSGWVATSGVKIIEPNGQLGVSIGWLNHAEHSQSLVGTNDWHYVTTGFYSGESDEVEICARLGGIASTSVGGARFRDLCLIEVND